MELGEHYWLENNTLGIILLGACKGTAYKVIKMRGYTGEGSPLSNVHVRVTRQ